MADISRLAESITASAQRDAEDIKAKALKEKEDYLLNLRETLTEDMKEVSKKARQDAEMLTSRTISKCAQQKKSAFLSLKTAEIQKIINLTKQEFIKSEKYFDRLAKMLDLKVDETQKQGIIYLSERDFKNMPDTFSKKLKKYNLTAKKADFEGGFILSYGLISENCSVDAFFKEKENILVDFLGQRLG